MPHLPFRPAAGALIGIAALGLAGCGGQPATNPPGTTVVTEWHVAGPVDFFLVVVLPALTILAMALFAWWLYRLIRKRYWEGGPEAPGAGGRLVVGRRTRLLVAALLTVAVLWVGAQVLVTAVWFVNGREARQRADAWLQQARQDARPDTTPDDAMRWLEQNGAQRVGRGEKAWVNGQEVEYHAVDGYRVISRSNFWSEPLTARLVFHFDSDWRFTNVDLECLRYEIH